MIRSFGPITYSGMTSWQNKDGIQTNYSFDPNDANKHNPFIAQWIWLNMEVFPDKQLSLSSTFCEDKGVDASVACFRKTITISKQPRKITAYISADSQYRFYIDKRLSARGPARVGGDYGNTKAPTYWFYDSYDFTELLSVGTHSLCAEVFIKPEAQMDYSMGRGGFILELETVYEDNSIKTIGTDSSWRGALEQGYRSYHYYDANKAEADWFNTSFSDQHWATVSNISKATGGIWNLIPRRIPPLCEVNIKPIEYISPFQQFDKRIHHLENLLSNHLGCSTIDIGEPVTFWLDFGKIYASMIHICVEGTKGTKLDIHTEEIIGKNESRETYILRGGIQEFEFFSLKSIRYLQIHISNFTGDVKIYDISLNAISYPVSYLGAFECSDWILNKAYLAGRWSNQICRQTIHLDSPTHQEGLGCTGDYLIESLMNYYTFGDPHLTRFDLQRTAYYLRQTNGLMFHTSYSLLWIQMLVEYHLYTGDDSLYIELFDVVIRLIDVFTTYLGNSGLIENSPNFMFMDWVPVGDYNMHHPPINIGQGYLTAFYYQALLNGITIAKHLGYMDVVTQYTQGREKVKLSFKQLWVEDKGLYCDGLSSADYTRENVWLPKGDGHCYFSQHTNSLAVLYNLAPIEEHTKIMGKVIEDLSLTQAQPYFMHFVLEAIHHAGLFNRYGNRMMRRWELLLKECESSLKEVWEGFDCDYSHAWGGTPTYQLPSKVLGIQPLSPGFTQFLISPNLGDLKWAKGCVPTPYGMIEINIENRHDELHLAISVPNQCIAIVKIDSENVAELKAGNYNITIPIGYEST